MAAPTRNFNFRNQAIEILSRGLRRKCLESALIALTRKFPRTRRLVPPIHSYQSKTYRIASRKGVSYRLNLNDPHSHSLYFFNPPDQADHLLKIIKSHWIVIDVGSDIGMVALRAAAVTNSGRVYAYEPQAEKFEELEYNIRLNPFKNIVAIKKAIGKSTHHAKLIQGDQADSCPNRITTRLGPDLECIEVAKLDDEFVRLKLDHVNVLRIDARGSELDVLLGAKQILEKFHPIVVIRFTRKSLKNHGRTAVEVIQFVRDMGYSCIDLKTSMPLITTIKDETNILCYV